MPKNISSTINPQVVKDIDHLVTKGHYRNRSHAVEEGLKRILAEQTSWSHYINPEKEPGFHPQPRQHPNEIEFVCLLYTQ